MTMPTQVIDEHSTKAVSSSEKRESSHAQILRSSAIVGGSQAINILIGIVRTKVMAVLLGPSGLALFGLFNSVATLAQTLAGMGINGSGVRQIAAAVSSGDQERIANTVLVLRRTSVLLGIIGIAIMLLFARKISQFTFDSEDQTSAIRWLSLAVFFMLIAASHGALVQGMRRIIDLAKIQILGALLGTMVSIPIVYFYRNRGVVPSLIGIAALTIVISWWYSRKISPSKNQEGYSLTFSETRREAKALLKLGIAFMMSGLISLGVAYLTRIILVHKVGMVETGLYQSAWTLGSLYVTFILQAMGADFYPRLSSSANDDDECNRLVNEQTHVGLLLAGPGVIGSLTFAPLVVALFYSTKFAPAVEVLRWICLGTILQVVTWPMGYVIIAKARRKILVICEILWGLVSIALACICIKYFGLNGAGIAFFASYIFHGLMITVIVGRLSGFTWSRDTYRTIVFTLFFIVIVFTSFYLLPLRYSVGTGSAIFLISSIYSYRSLSALGALELIIKRFTNFKCTVTG